MAISTVTAIPIMTSNTAPSGIASASSADASFPAYLAFNGVFNATGWRGLGATNQWLRYDFPTSKAIAKYSIATWTPTRSVKSWTFEGSNDGTIWEVLDTRTNITTWVAGVKQEFIVDSSKVKSYKMYRINCSVNNGDASYTDISELEMFERLYSNKFLISSEDEIHSIVSYKGTTTAIPVMTSDTVPSGKAFAKSFYNASYAPWKAFNGIDDVEGYASLSGSGGIGYLGYEFQNAISVYKYVVRSNGSGYLDRMPRNWTFEGSNDGVNWNVLDTQTNQTWTTQYTDKIYLLDAPFHYMQFKMYRLNWTANNGFASYTDVNELKMFEIIAPKLVKLPATSESSFVEYGMNKGESIDLASDISSINTINTSSSTLGSGKVFKQKINTSKTPIKKASIT